MALYYSDLKIAKRLCSQNFPDIHMGDWEYWGTGKRYYHWYIKFTPINYLPGIHYEYIINYKPGVYPRQSQLELHLEPHEEDLSFYRELGKRLMHSINSEMVKCTPKDDVHCGRFTLVRSSIETEEDLIKALSTLHAIINPVLTKLQQSVKRVKLDSPYTPLDLDSTKLDVSGEVSAYVLGIADVMNLPLTLPDYQRDYCWDDRNITDLWNNLEKIESSTSDNKKPFHLGTLILHKDGDKDGDKYDIIDGQQRLVTLTIILRALGCSHVNLPLLKAQYRDSDAITNVANCKYIIQNLVDKALDTNQLLSKIIDCVTFSVLIVGETHLDLAYTFFSNQNSKGVTLSDFDLLKAHHLRYIPGDEGGQAEHLASKWNNVSRTAFWNLDALQLVIGTHIYRLRKWMRKKESIEGTYRYVQHEYQAAPIMSDIPPFGERFNFYEKIQGGTHFFVYVETFIHRYEEFSRIAEVGILRDCLTNGRFSLFGDTIETLLFGYYLKFGSQYISEALACIARIMALYRYNTYAISSSGVGVRQFANEHEIVMMIDQASSPTFFLAEILDKHNELINSGDYQIRTGLDLEEVAGVKWQMHETMRNLFNRIKPNFTDKSISNLLAEEYGI